MLWSQIVNHYIIKLDTELFISTERRIIQNKCLYLLLWNINDLWVFWWAKYPHFTSYCGNAMSLLSVSMTYIVLYMKWHVKGWPVYCVLRGLAELLFLLKWGTQLLLCWWIILYSLCKNIHLHIHIFKWNKKFIVLKFICLVSLCGGTCMPLSVCVQLLRISPFFIPWWFRGQTQVVRLEDKCLYLGTILPTQLANS